MNVIPYFRMDGSAFKPCEVEISKGIMEGDVCISLTWDELQELKQAIIVEEYKMAVLQKHHDEFIAADVARRDTILYGTSYCPQEHLETILKAIDETIKNLVYQVVK